MHQSLDHLERFPKLLSSKEFIILRRYTFDSTPGDYHYPEECARKGELFKTASRYGSLQYLRNRAVFVREAKWYILFSNLCRPDPDLWYALESGIPLIQARALSTLSLCEYRSRVRILCAYNDLSSIPWTLHLTRELAKIVDSVVSTESPRLSYLRGYVGGKVLKFDRYDDNYWCGVADRKLKNIFTTEADPEIEKICEGRSLYGLTLYMPHLQRRMSKDPSFVPSIVIQEVSGIMEFHNLYPRELLNALDFYQSRTSVVTRASIAQMEQLLRREDFLEAFKGTCLPEIYRYICGYQTTKIYPGVSGGPNYYNSGQESIQQLVLYSLSFDGIRCDVNNRILATLGKEFIEQTYALVLYDSFDLEKLANPALAKLSGNNTPYDTSPGERWNQLTSEILARLTK